MDISYYEVYTMSKEEARRLIIETYLDNLYGIPHAM